MVNQLLLSRRLNKLREYVQLLKTIRLEARDRFVSDPLVYGNAERYLQLAIQVVLDIGNHILSDRKLKEPEEYRDVVRILGEQGILPAALAQRLLLNPKPRTLNPEP